MAKKPRTRKPKKQAEHEVAQTDMLSDMQAPHEDEDGEPEQEPAEDDSEETPVEAPVEVPVEKDLGVVLGQLSVRLRQEESAASEQAQAEDDLVAAELETAEEPERKPERTEDAVPTDEDEARVPVPFEMVPEEGVAVPAAPAGERLGRAKDLVRDGRIDEAIALYSDILVQNPANLKARNNLGVLYDELGRLELALEQFEAAELIEPENVELLNNYGSVVGAMGRYDDAEELLRRAQRLDPEDVSVRASIGILHFRRGVYTMAEEDLSWVCEQNDAHGPAFYYRGEALNRLGRFDEAMQALERATVLQPQKARAFYTLGHLYDRKHMGEEATLMYRRARELSRG